jgi:hypothetical protein
MLYRIKTIFINCSSISHTIKCLSKTTAQVASIPPGKPPSRPSGTLHTVQSHRFFVEDDTFLRKLGLKLRRTRRARRPTPRQAAPRPHGESLFRRFMDSSIDVTDEHETRSMAQRLHQDSFVAEATARACRTPVADGPRRYFGFQPQPSGFQLEWSPPPRTPLQVRFERCHV